MNGDDAILQNCPPSFDIHVQEILGSLFFGVTLIMLHPYGQLDMAYLCSSIRDKFATYSIFVPTVIAMLSQYLSACGERSYIQTIRSFCSIGKQSEKHKYDNVTIVDS
jgi:acyl-coenzyme A synthetase/AMP-(fatty) acid ligase